MFPHCNGVAIEGNQTSDIKKSDIKNQASKHQTFFTFKIISMKLITLILLCAVMSSTAQPVKTHGQLKVTGPQLMDQHNQPLVLNGMSFGWSCFHPRFYTSAATKWLHKDWQCDVVRAALGVEPDRGYLKDSARSVQLVKTVVDAAIEEGIYVIIDWHSHNLNLKEAKSFFATMATTYGS